MDLWQPHDPGRRCYTCGALPDHAFMDGSPAYSCTHPPVTVLPPYPWPEVTVDVTLSDMQMRAGHAYAEGVLRRALERGGHHQSPTGEQAGRPASLERNVIGFLGEIAAAALTGLRWNDREWSGRRDRDIGRRVEVKSTRVLGAGLHMYPRDSRRYVFLLMQTWRPDFRRWRAIGWLEGRELEDHRFEAGEDRDGRPIFEAPRTALHPLPLPDDS